MQCGAVLLRSLHYHSQLLRWVRHQYWTCVLERSVGGHFTLLGRQRNNSRYKTYILNTTRIFVCIHVYIIHENMGFDVRIRSCPPTPPIGAAVRQCGDCYTGVSPWGWAFDWHRARLAKYTCVSGQQVICLKTLLVYVVKVRIWFKILPEYVGHW